MMPVSSHARLRVHRLVKRYYLDFSAAVFVAEADFAAAALGAPPFLSRSRISVSNSWFLVGFGGVAGAASSLAFILFIRRMTMNSTAATIRKFSVMVRKLP